MKFLAMIAATLITTSAFADEEFISPKKMWAPRQYDALLKFKKDDIAHYCQLVDDHYHDGKKCEEIAKKTSYILPDCKDKDMAIYCFTTFMASFASNTPKSKLVSMALALLTNYGIQIMGQWEIIIENLHKAQYHYEMSDFYYHVLCVHGCEEYYDSGNW